MNQAQLAELVERTPEAISNLETGKSLPSIETLFALSEALGVSITELIPANSGSRDASPIRIARETEGAHILSRLSDRNLEVALAQLKALADLAAPK